MIVSCKYTIKGGSMKQKYGEKVFSPLINIGCNPCEFLLFDSLT